MASPFNLAVAVGGLTCILVIATSCHRTAPKASVPNTAPATVATQHDPMMVDQVNGTGWEKAWTNLVNDVEESFTPALSRLKAVEVELVVGNPGPTEELVTLTVLDVSGRVVAVVPKSVQTDDCNQVMFVIPNGGVDVTPRQTYVLKLSGGNTFGWKYIVGGYENGAATLNGKPLLADARSTFLFRTFGTT